METLKCEICEACFKSEMALTGHKISVHGSRNLHPCKLCPASFSEQSSLTSHISSVHLKPKPFSCLNCSESFLTIEGMTVHIIFHEEQNQLEETVHEVKHPLYFDGKKNYFPDESQGNKKEPGNFQLPSYDFNADSDDIDEKDNVKMAILQNSQQVFLDDKIKTSRKPRKKLPPGTVKAKYLTSDEKKKKSS